MRALLYKDLILTWKTCRMVMLAVLIFTVMAGVGEQTLLFAVYSPIVLTATTLTTLAYDERSGWLRYADGLPYGRNTIVKSKYVMALLCCATSMLVTAAAGVVAGLLRSSLVWESLLLLAMVQLLAGTIQTVILLPVSLRMGVEKGRIVYIICIAAFCAFGLFLPQPGNIMGHGALVVECLATIAVCLMLWTASYFIGAAVFRKRKL